MTAKTSSDCEISFRMIEAILDKAIESLKADLVDFKFIDSSNRTGFEKYVSPYYLWAMTIQCDDNSRGYIKRYAVNIEYLEPWDWNDSKRIKISAVAEKFNIGQESFFKEKNTYEIGADTASAEKL